MSLNIVKDSIDIGIVTTNLEEMVKFYRNTLGLTLAGEMQMPGGGHMTRLMCGTTVVKLVVNAQAPSEKAVGGGLAGATGYRYWTISVSNLEEATEQCRDAGYSVPVGPVEIRSGVSIAMIEDPDGNWVELLQMVAG